MDETVTTLIFDGAEREYHPATGLDLVPGEWAYPNEHVEVLMATGRFVTEAAPETIPPIEEKE